MAPLEPSGSLRPELPNIDEEEKDNLKDNFVKIIEAIKEAMKNLLKEREENTNKKMGRNQ